MNAEMVDEFCKLRLQLFEELGEISSIKDIHALEEATKTYYGTHINKDLISWCIKSDHEIVAIASLCLFNRIPYEGNLTGLEGYILNVYTVPAYRKQGFAKHLITEIIEYTKENQIKRLWLNSSQDGQAIYYKAGFKMKDNEMELFLS